MAPNAVVQTYFNPGAAGQLRRYCAASCLGVGVLLPVAAPLLALCLINPWIKLLLEVSTVITPASACFDGGGAAVCPGASAVDYYFWNVTNALQARPDVRRRPRKHAAACPRPCLRKTLMWCVECCQRGAGAACACALPLKHADLIGCPPYRKGMYKETPCSTTLKDHSCTRLQLSTVGQLGRLRQPCRGLAHGARADATSRSAAKPGTTRVPWTSCARSGWTDGRPRHTARSAPTASRRARA